MTTRRTLTATLSLQYARMLQLAGWLAIAGLAACSFPGRLEPTATDVHAKFAAAPRVSPEAVTIIGFEELAAP